MDMECVFVFAMAILCSIIGGYVGSAKLNTNLFTEAEQFFFPAIAALLSGMAGLLLGLLLYNIPLVVLGILTWAVVIRYTIIRGLRKNRTKYPI